MKPSKPRCYAEGPTLEGKDMVLRCLSKEGTKPLQYSWQKTSGSMLLPASSVMGNGPARNANLSFAGVFPSLANAVVSSLFLAATADPMGGTINVKNASAGMSGTYRCSVTNRVGTEECVLQLNVTPRE